MDYNFENIATFNVFGYGFQSINLDTYIPSKGEKYPNMVLVSHKMIDVLLAFKSDVKRIESMLRQKEGFSSSM